MAWLRAQIGSQWLVGRKEVVIHYRGAKTMDRHQTDEGYQDWHEICTVLEFLKDGHDGFIISLNVDCDPAPAPAATPADPVAIQQSQAPAALPRGRGTATNVQLQDAAIQLQHEADDCNPATRLRIRWQCKNRGCSNYPSQCWQIGVGDPVHDHYPLYSNAVKAWCAAITTEEADFEVPPVDAVLLLRKAKDDLEEVS